MLRGTRWGFPILSSSARYNSAEFREMIRYYSRLAYIWVRYAWSGSISGSETVESYSLWTWESNQSEISQVGAYSLSYITRSFYSITAGKLGFNVLSSKGFGKSQRASISVGDSLSGSCLGKFQHANHEHTHYSQ
jgi:hypothetical protein